MMFDGVLAERPVQALKILIDSGASHSFVSQRVVIGNSLSIVAQQHGSLKLANNTFFDTKPLLSGRLIRWADRLSKCTFLWEHRPGRLNVADPLSRLPSSTTAVICCYTACSTDATLKGVLSWWSHLLYVHVHDM